MKFIIVIWDMLSDHRATYRSVSMFISCVVSLDMMFTTASMGERTSVLKLHTSSIRNIGFPISQALRLCPSM